MTDKYREKTTMNQENPLSSLTGDEFAKLPSEDKLKIAFGVILKLQKDARELQDELTASIEREQKLKAIIEEMEAKQPVGFKA
jgi:predicted glycosyltransferase